VLIAREAGIHIASAADITDAVGACLGAYGALVVGEEDLAPAVFDLRTGLAGELFQKFVNYGLRLAVIVPDPAAHGPRFAELAREHASHPMVRMLRSRAEADAWLHT